MGSLNKCRAAGSLPHKLCGWPNWLKGQCHCFPPQSNIKGTVQCLHVGSFYEQSTRIKLVPLFNTYFSTRKVAQWSLLHCCLEQSEKSLWVFLQYFPWKVLSMPIAEFYVSFAGKTNKFISNKNRQRWAHAPSVAAPFYDQQTLAGHNTAKYCI